jgi:Mitochondrial calcium uniporter
MEPVAYFVSLGTAIGFYLYFLLTNEAFDYQPLQNRLFSRWHNARLQAESFDHAMYNK